MQIYFGAVHTDEVIDPSCMLVSENDDDNFYYYGVEYGSNPGGTDEVLIYDTVGREVPIDSENIPALIDALKLAYSLYELNKFYANVTDKICDAGETATIIPR